MSPKILRMRFFLLPAWAGAFAPEIGLVAMGTGSPRQLGRRMHAGGNVARAGASRDAERPQRKAHPGGCRTAAFNRVSRSAGLPSDGAPPRQAHLARSIRLARI